MKTRLIPILLLLLAVPQRAPADALATLPAAWSQRLLAVAVPNLEGQPADVSTALEEARARVDALLDGGAEAAELADAYGDLGALYQTHQLGRAAERCFDNALRLAPDSFRWAYYLAWAAQESGRSELALERYANARELDPDYYVLTLRMADAWLAQNEQDKAQAAYRAVMDVEGLEAAARYGLGQIALLRRDYTVAVEYLSEVLALDPEATRVHYPLAQALRALQRDAEAREHLALRGNGQPQPRDPLVESLQTLRSGARVQFNRAMRAVEKHDYETAVAAFAQGLKYEPDNADARVSYARALYLAGEGEAAQAQLEAVLERQPDHVMGRFLHGVLQEEAGDTAGAARDYHRVLASDPAHGGAHFHLGNHYLRAGEPAAAAQHYARAVAADPRNVPARLLQLAALEQLEAPDSERRRVLEAAVREVPEQPLFTAMLIRLLITSPDPGVVDPATALALAQHLSGERASPPLRELQALAYAAAGDFEAAEAIQQKLLSMAVWSMPGETARLELGLAAYRDGRLPAADVLAPQPPAPQPVLNAQAVVRDYPAAKPY